MFLEGDLGRVDELLSRFTAAPEAGPLLGQGDDLMFDGEGLPG